MDTKADSTDSRTAETLDADSVTRLLDEGSAHLQQRKADIFRAGDWATKLIAAIEASIEEYMRVGLAPDFNVPKERKHLAAVIGGDLFDQLYMIDGPLRAGLPSSARDDK